MRYGVAFERSLPLTLTLSLREREQQASDWCLADGGWANSGTGVIERLWTILPLPRGEGRGEGEPRVAHPTVRSVIFNEPFRFTFLGLCTRFSFGSNERGLHVFVTSNGDRSAAIVRATRP